MIVGPEPAWPDSKVIHFKHESSVLRDNIWGDPTARELLYIDVGSRDQYNIQYGGRAFTRQLEKLGIGHHYEEFDGTHSGMDWRLDVSLPLLANALYKVSQSAGRARGLKY